MLPHVIPWNPCNPMLPHIYSHAIPYNPMSMYSHHLKPCSPLPISGPSIPLFTRLYEERCVVFDDIHGWERQPVDLRHWWRRVPASMRSRIHFHNVGVHEGSMAEVPPPNLPRPPFLGSPPQLSCLVTPSAAQVLINRTWATPTPRGAQRPSSPTSFLRLLRETVRPQDFVVVKVSGPRPYIDPRDCFWPRLYPPHVAPVLC